MDDPIQSLVQCLERDVKLLIKENEDLRDRNLSKREIINELSGRIQDLESEVHEIRYQNESLQKRLTVLIDHKIDVEKARNDKDCILEHLYDNVLKKFQKLKDENNKIKYKFSTLMKESCKNSNNLSAYENKIKEMMCIITMYEKSSENFLKMVQAHKRDQCSPCSKVSMSIFPKLSLTLDNKSEKFRASTESTPNRSIDLSAVNRSTPGSSIMPIVQSGSCPYKNSKPCKTKFQAGQQGSCALQRSSQLQENYSTTDANACNLNRVSEEPSQTLEYRSDSFYESRVSEGPQHTQRNHTEVSSNDRASMGGPLFPMPIQANQSSTCSKGCNRNRASMGPVLPLESQANLPGTCSANFEVNRKSDRLPQWPIPMANQSGINDDSFAEVDADLNEFIQTAMSSAQALKQSTPALKQCSIKRPPSAANGNDCRCDLDTSEGCERVRPLSEMQPRADRMKRSVSPSKSTLASGCNKSGVCGLNYSKNAHPKIDDSYAPSSGTTTSDQHQHHHPENMLLESSGVVSYKPNKSRLPPYRSPARRQQDFLTSTLLGNFKALEQFIVNVYKFLTTGRPNQCARKVHLR